jgi:hypothetical protein
MIARVFFLVFPLLGVISGMASPLLTRGPYLQLGTPVSMVVRWRTDIDTDSQVLYGIDPTTLDQTNRISAGTTEHEVLLTGLTPATRYFYSIGTTTNVLAPATVDQYFITSPPMGKSKPTRVWVIGDAGTSGDGDPVETAEQTAVRDAYYALAGTNHTDLWLQLGDNAYPSGKDSEYQVAVFDIYAGMLRKSVTWPALGNHDTDLSTDYNTNYPYFAIFTLPSAGEAGGAPSGTEHYYSFDYANLHFVCLDSMTADRSTNGAMAAWLETDLQGVTSQWIIAYWHHPPYSRGSHISDGEIQSYEMRQNFLPILEAYGVDLVLTGHSHSYERSFLLNGHYGQSSTLSTNMLMDAGTGREEETGAYVKPRGYAIANRGTVYAVAGSSGHLSGGTLDHPAMCISTNVLGSMLIEVSSNRLDAIFLRETGATNDHFTILKANFPPVASNLSFTLPANSSPQLNFLASDINRDPLQFFITTQPTNGLLSLLNPLAGKFVYTPVHGSTNSDFFTFLANDGEMNSLPANVTISIIPPADTNHNGLPDAWEAQFNVSDPDADDDLDGMTNLQEYWAGTNPRDPQSWLRVNSLTAGPAGGFTLTWPSVGGVRYRVQFSDGDSTGGFNGPFIPIVRSAAAEIAPTPIGIPSTMSYTDDFVLTDPPLHGNRYYRIQLVK